MKTIYFLPLCLVCLFSAACVEPQRFVTLENRVAAIEMENNRQSSRQNDSARQQLKNTVETLVSRMDQGHLLTREEYAELRYEMKTLAAEFQGLEGRFQEIVHATEQMEATQIDEIRTMINRLDLAVSKNYEKILAIEKYMGFEPSVSSDVTTDEAAADVQDDDIVQDPEQQLYDLAKKLFDDGDRENARIQFENFINRYPESDKADNARFWIADSYYAQKWFEKAILEYQKVLEEYPDSNKLPAARLKQGYAFSQLGENANARLILKELIKRHPDSDEAKYATEKLKQLE